MKHGKRGTNPHFTPIQRFRNKRPNANVTLVLWIEITPIFFSQPGTKASVHDTKVNIIFLLYNTNQNNDN